MADSTLKACPFCGGRALPVCIVTPPRMWRYAARWAYRVRCVRCSARTRDYTTEKAAIRRWNTRKELRDE